MKLDPRHQKKRCKADLSGCSQVDLCKTATYMSFGKKVWKKGFDEEFVTEAKRRGLTCEVKSEIEKTHLETNAKPIKPESSSQSRSEIEKEIESHIEGIYGLLEGKVGLSRKKRSSESISAELGEILGEIDSISSWKDKTSQDVQQTMERIKELRSALKDIRDNIWWYFKKN